MSTHISRRRFLAQALALAAAAPIATRAADVLAAGVPSPPALPTPSGTAPAPGRAAEEVVFWHTFGGDLGARLERYIEEGFNARNDGIAVKPRFAAPSYGELLDKLLPAIRAGTAPDVVQTSTVIQLAKLGALQPLDNLIPATGIELDDFIPGLLEDNRYNGQLYGLPSSRSTPVLFYNDDLFYDDDVEGRPRIDPPTFLSSWENFATEGLKLVKKEGSETTRFLYSAPPAWWFWTQLVWVFGGEMSDADGNVLFNQGPAVDALKFWQDLIHRHGVAKTYPAGTGFAAWDAAAADWFSQRAVVSAHSSAQVTRMLSTARFRVGVAPLPGMRAGGMEARAVPHGGSNLMLLATSQRREAAIAFMAWLTSPEGTSGWHILSGYVPVRTSAQHSQQLRDWFRESPAHQVAVDQLAVARSTPVIAQMAEFDTQISPALLERVLLEPGDVQTALDEAAQETETLWKRFISR